ncbi:SRPBCC domain-containing protein [Rhodococcus sovatensis]|uniref:SRPBCC domain-containing protein n=1 Tax=Rhodococcus sovatensis TaxID=1805840 RepID=A0ABZ2PHZ3_9NOCA
MSELSIPAYDIATLVRSITVDIDAPASVVWNVLVDLPNYHTWNPFCIAAESTLKLGAPVEMTLKNYAGTDGTFTNTEYVCAFVPERLLSWELLATADTPNAARRDQIIERVAESRCRYYSTDAFLGEISHEIMAENGSWVKRAFDDTAVALKSRSEAIFAEYRRGSIPKEVSR